MGGIISTEELASILQQPGLRIIDARGNFATYLDDHIPGAQMLHIETLRLSDHGVPCKMMPSEALGVIFGRLGITRNTPVVIYTAGPDDQLSATYTAWSLSVTGNTDVRVLDGGLHTWELEQRPLTQGFPSITDATYTAQFAPALFADLAYVRDHMNDPDVVLVDTRLRSMYAGATGPGPRRGHIPGAVLHNYLWDFTARGTYRSLDDLRLRYLREGIIPEKEIITYCMTGREGSAAWFVLKYLLGYPRVRLYQASLMEWLAHPELPIVTGNTPMGTGHGEMGQAA